MIDFNRLDCLDCGRRSGGLESLEEGYDPVNKIHLCVDCKSARNALGVSLEDPEPKKLKDVVIPVELQWRLTAEDLRYAHYGDRTQDFIRRSGDRVRAALETLRAEGILTHYVFNIHEGRRVFGDD